jgi:hypothetical protein
VRDLASFDRPCGATSLVITAVYLPMFVGMVMTIYLPPHGFRPEANETPPSQNF